jgi:hypothetical protein
MRSVPIVLAALAALAACIGAGLASAQAAPTGISAPNPVPPTRAEVRAADAHYAGTASKGTAPAAIDKRARELLPKNRIVALYGSAHPGFGVLGRKTAKGARRKLKHQVKPYKRKGNRPVIPAFDLVATVATRCESHRDKCRTRISNSTVEKYLHTIRAINGRLILDIQPARSTFLDEVKHWHDFLLEPDVSVGLDPEWNVGPHGTPGETVGSVSARKLNKVSDKLQGIAEDHNLPDKPMIVHQFRKGSIHHRAHVKLRKKVDVVLNFDGIGDRQSKKAGYESLLQPPLFNGFSLFYKLDSGLMSPGQVLNLTPKPDYVMYQ